VSSLRIDFHQLYEEMERLAAQPKGSRMAAGQALEERFGEDIADYVALAMKIGIPLEHVVVPVHGIRDDGGWFTLLQRSLQSRPDIKIQPGGYGYLHVMKFLLPGKREPVYEEVVRTLRSAQGQNRVISVICHSFGTWCVTKAILEHADIRIFRLIMCGSIVPRDFPWQKVPAALPSGRVVNDCGNLDAWPIYAHCVNSIFGDTGRLGFSHFPVVDRWHDVKHSGFFTSDMITKYWAPFLAGGSIVQSPLDLIPPRGLLNLVAGRWP
jgi:hypothetical protein